MATLRPIPHDREVGTDEQSSFADLAGRPLLIVGNGPSGVFPAYEKIPANPVVFRLNWFFLESHYHYGSHVDAFFYSVPTEGLESHLADEIRSGRYQVDRLLSPMRVSSLRSDDNWQNNLLGLKIEELDHWALISRHPRLARYFMSRPGLPTQGMQALAFGLAAGFTDIYLAGVDMYESKQARYGHAIPDEVAKSVLAKDLAPGYESTGAHSVDYDLSFLQACQAEFPEARIVNLGESRNLRQYLPDGAEISDAPTLRQEPLERQAQAKPHLALKSEADGGDLFLAGREEREQYLEIDGRKCAYVTLVSGDYHHGARALANSLREVSDVPLLVMCAPGANKYALEQSGLTCIDVPEILNPSAGKDGVLDRFAATYTKLNVFRLDFLDRIVFIDADTVALRSIDDLFTRKGFCAVSDAGRELDRDEFNSGVMGLEPSRKVFDQMMAKIGKLDSSDGGDQGFLNSFMDSWERLPIEYNTTKRVFVSHPVLFDDRTRVVHYVGHKPWQTPSDAHREYLELNADWLNHLREFELRDLIRSWLVEPALSKKSPAKKGPAQDGPGIKKMVGMSRGAGTTITGKSYRDGRKLLESGDAESAEAIALGNLATNPGSVANLKLLRDARLRDGNVAGGVLAQGRVAFRMGVNVLRGRR